MKVFILVWAIVGSVLLICGNVWAYLDRKNEKRRKAPAILIIIASFMLVIYFWVLMQTSLFHSSPISR